MDKHITYRFEVNATFGLATEADDPDFYTEEQAISVERRRDLEKALFRHLRRFEGDCDVELMDFTVEED